MTITVDAGYRTEVASGSGLNAPFSFDFSTCGTGGGFSGPGTCNVKERYTPTALTSSSGTTNVFECPIIGGTCIGIPYTETGTGISTASASPSNVDFGGVPINTTASRSISVTVDAGYRLSLASGSGISTPFSFSFGACTNFPGPGSCSVTESYRPTTFTPSSGTLTMSECPVAGGSCLPINVPVQGSGASAFAASPPSLDFGDVPINSTAKRSISFAADPGYKISWPATGTAVSSPFVFSFDSCFNFAGPGNCTASEAFKPTTLTRSSGALTLSECPVAGGACFSINVAVQGNGARIASSVALTSSANPSLGGRSVTFKAKVTAPGAVTPTGTVTFTDGETTLGTISLDGNGRAFLPTSSLSVGSHTISAVYSGDATFASSSDSLTQTVTGTDS